MVYLFTGQDCLSKSIQFKRIKEEFLKKDLEEFNLDILYAKGLALGDLQERLLSIPLRSSRRILWLKDAHNLKENIKEFVIKYVRKPRREIILILDTDQQDKLQDFIKRADKYLKIYRFKETVKVNTFALSRSIDIKRPDYALRVLRQLLQNGERPERILGGLRYTWGRTNIHSLEKRKRLRLLLDCDIDIKTGRLKGPFALEKLVVGLCALTPRSH